MKTHTHTATVREMRSLVNTSKKHADDAANSWKHCHTLAATAHSAANRADMGAIDAENAALRAHKALRSIIIAFIIATAINTAITCFL